MQKTDFIWHNGKMYPWDEAKIHVLTHSLHYGGAAFEGIRAYETEKGPAVFRLKEHLERLFYSCSVINLKLPYTLDELNDAVIETIKVNKLKQCYIRPLAFFGYGKMGVNPTGAPSELIIACWPWGAYLPYDMVDIQTSQFIRIPPNATIADAKLTGNYINCILAILKLQGTHYHEALFLDTNDHIAEGPGENFFIVKNNTIYTPTLGAILAGITRDTVKTIAHKLGIDFVEKDITLNDAYQADEAFFSGTAAEITPIRTIDDKVIGNGTVGSITQKIRETYLNMACGKNKEFEKFLTYVE